MWAMPSSWPEFMLHDPIGNGYYAALDLFAEHVLVCFDETGDVVAKAFSVPFHLDGGDLPADGWDGVVRRGLAGRLPGGREPNAVSAVEIAVRPDMQAAASPPRCWQRCATTPAASGTPSWWHRYGPAARPTRTSR